MSEPQPQTDTRKPFILCQILSPTKQQDTPGTFVSYEIKTLTNHKAFKSTEFSVKRRFSDFVTLYQVLNNDYPACIIPPLPDKQVLGYISGDRFGAEFIDKRSKSLSIFLNRLVSHPVLSESTVFHIFLESRDWSIYKRQLNIKISETDHVGDMLVNAFKSAKQSDEFMEIKGRCDKLDENLNRIDKIYHKIIKRDRDIVDDYEKLSAQYKQLGSLQPALANELGLFSNGLLDMSRGFHDLSQYLEQDYAVGIKDLEHYIGQVKNMIKLKEQKQIDYEELSSYLSKAVNDKNNLVSGYGGNYFTQKLEELAGVNQEMNRRDKINKLEVKIESLTTEVDSAKEIAKHFEEQALQEIDTFEEIKGQELKSSLTELADKHIEFYTNLIGRWEKISEEL